jgi:hypothetical protein
VFSPFPPGAPGFSGTRSPLFPNSDELVAFWYDGCVWDYDDADLTLSLFVFQLADGGLFKLQQWLQVQTTAICRSSRSRLEDERNQPLNHMGCMTELDAQTQGCSPLSVYNKHILHNSVSETDSQKRGGTKTRSKLRSIVHILSDISRQTSGRNQILSNFIP